MIILRLLRLASPLGSAVALRLAQLGVLVVGSFVAPADLRLQFLASFSIVAAFGVFADAGAPAYLISRKAINRQLFDHAIVIQALIAVLGAAAAVAFSQATLPWPSPAIGIGITSALAASQALDSVTRAARSARMQQRDDLGFALGDAFNASAKIAVVVVGALTGSLLFLVALPAASLAVAIATIGSSRSRLTRRPDQKFEIVGILQFGVSGALSGLYSQAPYLIAAGTAPLAVTAALSVVLRVMQPLEIAPAVMSQQIMPRVVPSHLRAPRLWILFVLFGAFLAVLLGCFRPLLESIFEQNLAPVLLWLLLATMPFKFGSYLLSAFVLALNGVSWKIIASLVAGGAAITVALSVGGGSPQVGFPTAMLVGETVLSLLLMLAILRLRIIQRKKI